VAVTSTAASKQVALSHRAFALAGSRVPSPYWRYLQVRIRVAARAGRFVRTRSRVGVAGVLGERWRARSRMERVARPACRFSDRLLHDNRAVRFILPWLNCRPESVTRDDGR
jgi:hypothetical protein